MRLYFIKELILCNGTTEIKFERAKLYEVDNQHAEELLKTDCCVKTGIMGQ